MKISVFSCVLNGQLLKIKNLFKLCFVLDILMVIKSWTFKASTYLQFHKPWLYLRTSQISNMLKVQGVCLIVSVGLRKYEIASAKTKTQWPYCLERTGTEIGTALCYQSHAGIMHEKCILLNKGCLFTILFAKHASWRKCHWEFWKKKLVLTVPCEKKSYCGKKNCGKTYKESHCSTKRRYRNVRFYMKNKFRISAL